jgi:hypothetical protein
MNGRCLNCRTRAVADRYRAEARSTAITRLAHLLGADVRVVVRLREGAIVLECSYAGQRPKLYREVVEPVRQGGRCFRVIGPEQ